MQASQHFCFTPYYSYPPPSPLLAPSLALFPTHLQNVAEHNLATAQICAVLLPLVPQRGNLAGRQRLSRIKNGVDGTQKDPYSMGLGFFQGGGRVTNLKKSFNTITLKKGQINYGVQFTF